MKTISEDKCSEGEMINGRSGRKQTVEYKITDRNLETVQTLT